ncbi:unnamed protein product [Parajaminaea phylloscopi]
MDGIVSSLAADLAAKVLRCSPTERYLVGIAGIPGSGKSTLAELVCSAVNAKLREDQGHGRDLCEVQAVVVGMDGWHFSRQTLEGFPDPQTAKDRRGAAFTFDARAFADFVVSLKSRPQQTVKAPSFSHSLKDPVAEDIPVEREHRLVIIEGLYCNCDEGDWGRGAAALDERWVLDVEKEIARERLRVRHVITGVAKDEAEALWRADNNDLVNGDWLLSHLLEPVKRIRQQ